MAAPQFTLKSLVREVYGVITAGPSAEKRPVNEDEYCGICAMIVTIAVVSLNSVALLAYSLAGPVWTLEGSKPQDMLWEFNDGCSEALGWISLLGMVSAGYFYYQAYGKSPFRIGITVALTLVGCSQAVGLMIQVSHDPSQVGEAILFGVGAVAAQLILRRLLQNLVLPPQKGWLRKASCGGS